MAEGVGSRREELHKGEGGSSQEWLMEAVGGMEAASRCKSDRSSIWGSPSSKTNKAELWIRYSCRCRRKNSQIPSKYTEGGRGL